MVSDQRATIAQGGNCHSRLLSIKYFKITHSSSRKFVTEMKELIPENNEKLNQESKKALLALKQKPEKTGLYCLQLAGYSLKHNLEDPDGRLTTTLEEMHGWKPQEVMNYLQRDPETNEEKDAVDWNLVNNDPNELADQILIAIGDNLALTLPCYPKNLFKARV